MNENYIEIMLQSLRKKLKVLDWIIELNKQQKILLDDPNLPPETFERNLADKESAINSLNELDEGFEELYARVRDALQTDRSLYAEQIREMQQLIKVITEKSTLIQTQEIRNKEKLVQKFSKIRKKVKGVRNSQRVVQQYYQSMMKQNYSSSASILDNKK